MSLWILPPLSPWRSAEGFCLMIFCLSWETFARSWGGCFPMVFLCLLDDFWILFLGWFATVCPCVPKGWLFPACFENCDILLGITRVTLALPNIKSLFAIEFLTQKWQESKTKGQGGPAAHRFLGISCSNFKPWNWWDMGLHKLWPKTFTQVSKQFQAIKHN